MNFLQNKLKILFKKRSLGPLVHTGEGSNGLVYESVCMWLGGYLYARYRYVSSPNTHVPGTLCAPGKHQTQT